MVRHSRRPFHWFVGTLAALLLALPSLTDANTEPFEVDTTGDLLKACDWKENDPLYVRMVTFCLGYVSSAIQYDEALNPDQKDSDSLPDYSVLDPILEAFIEEDLSVKEIVARGFERDIVIRVLELVKRNEYKRRQAPPGIRISSRAFGRDWRYPITSRYTFPE